MGYPNLETEKWLEIKSERPRAKSPALQTIEELNYGGNYGGLVEFFKIDLIEKEMDKKQQAAFTEIVKSTSNGRMLEFPICSEDQLDQLENLMSLYKKDILDFFIPKYRYLEMKCLRLQSICAKMREEVYTYRSEEEEQNDYENNFYKEDWRKWNNSTFYSCFYLFEKSRNNLKLLRERNEALSKTLSH